MRFCLIAALAASASAATRACSTTTQGPAIPTPPASDPFWSPPSNFDSLSPGHVFGCRKVNWNTALGDNTVAAYYQYAYKSALRSGQQVVAVATLIIPSSNPGPYSQLLSYQVPYDSPTSFCAPSYAFTTGSSPTTTNTYAIGQGQDNATVYALAAGIPVVVADYESSVAAFTVGQSAGLGTLNGIEAVVGYSGLFTDNPNVALWGYSGGALATDFALELATTYQPTYPYTIIGSALGGLTPNTRHVANAINAPTFDVNNPATELYSALIPLALLGMGNENATVSDWLQSHLKTDIQPGKLFSYKDRFNHAKSDNCNIEVALDYANTDFNTWFNLDGAKNATLVPVISDALDLYGIMGNYATPTTPMYFYKGTADEVSPILDTENLYNKYCQNGASIQYRRITNDTHSEAQTDGRDGAWNYLQALFNGAKPTGCSSSSS